MTRLDVELVARGLARSRTHAQRLIAEGQVRVDGAVATRASDAVSATVPVTAISDPYVSRAAHKLLGALDDLSLSVGRRCLDAGASTGGFTQVLLERGAAEVVAVDVGVGQLAPSVRADPRVSVHEHTNLRDLSLPGHLGGVPVDLTVADVSFISLTMLVGPLAAATHADGSMLLMVKPQFEVGRERLGRGGVVRSGRLHAEAVAVVVEAAATHGWRAQGGAPSRVLGPAGNREFFVLFATRPPAEPFSPSALVAR
ncbi:MAG: TlyA family methyltransferase [Friedmanniella sp.]|nr:TlyA family methyltransferase [Friedmanniella sp.]